MHVVELAESRLKGALVELVLDPVGREDVRLLYLDFEMLYLTNLNQFCEGLKVAAGQLKSVQVSGFREHLSQLHNNDLFIAHGGTWLLLYR